MRSLSTFANMKKTILTFGPISAAMMAAMYVVFCLARDSGNILLSQILTYTGAVLLFVMLFFGIKYYRDHAQSGFITFGKAFQVGIYISLVTSVCSALIWMILYEPVFKDFMDHHTAALIEKLNTSGAPVAEIASKKEEILSHDALYDNPIYRAGIIFIQGFPVEAIMTVIAAFVLKKKQV